MWGQTSELNWIPPGVVCDWGIRIYLCTYAFHVVRNITSGIDFEEFCILFRFLKHRDYLQRVNARVTI